MGENVGRGLIGTGLSLGSANRTLGDRLFGVTTFGSDGIYGPYAVVENVVAVEYPEQPEACWEAIDDVLVTMSLKIQ